MLSFSQFAYATVQFDFFFSITQHVQSFNRVLLSFSRNKIIPLARFKGIKFTTKNNFPIACQIAKQLGNSTDSRTRNKP